MSAAATLAPPAAAAAAAAFSYHPYTDLMPPPPSRAATGARPLQRPPRPPSLLQVGVDRLRSAPRSAMRSDPGYTQRRHPSCHLALSTLAKGFRSSGEPRGAPHAASVALF